MKYAIVFLIGVLIGLYFPRLIKEKEKTSDKTYSSWQSIDTIPVSDTMIEIYSKLLKTYPYYRINITPSKGIRTIYYSVDGIIYYNSDTLIIR